VDVDSVTVSVDLYATTCLQRLLFSQQIGHEIVIIIIIISGCSWCEEFSPENQIVDRVLVIVAKG